MPHRRGVILAVGFWVYAMILVLGTRWAAHELFHGWPARVATIGGIALGMLPWARWLRPRIAWVLGLAGQWALVGCYFTLMVPFALIARITGDPLRLRRPAGGSRWIRRGPIPGTVESARREY